jgi:hypothetical protein
MKNVFLTTVLITMFFSLAVLAQQRFEVGDQVEVLYSGKWYKARILEVGDGKYKITYEGYSSAWDTWIESSKVRGLAGQNKSSSLNTNTSNSNANRSNSENNAKAVGRFRVGDHVEFSRWNNSVYEGEIVGIDRDRYQILYKWNGNMHKEWIQESYVRPSKNAASFNRSSTNPAPTSGKFNFGDRVIYTGGHGFKAGTGEIIAVDPYKREYMVRDSKNPVKVLPTFNCYEIIKPNDKSHNDFFIGKWHVFMEAAISTVERSGDLYRRYSTGTYLPPLEIISDGTYVWRTDKGTIRGRWVAHNEGHGITLLKALDGKDYTLSENTKVSDVRTPRDQISISFAPTDSMHFGAYRIGENKSCLLTGRTFDK